MMESMKAQRRNVYSVLALRLNVDSLESFLKREELSDHLACLR